MADPKPEPESEPKNSATITKLIKGLASTNPKIRSKSLITLTNWLPSQTLISNDVMKKLWKSLFYSMWHCDKIQNQTYLINQLTNLLLVLPKSLSLSYFSNFIVAIRREWNGIDRLRLDKFYLLIRFFVRNLFVLMGNNKWGLAEIECFVEVLEKDLFFVENDEVGFGFGVCYHVVSVFCDELLSFLPLGLGVLKVLFRPFVGAMGRSENKVLVGKVKGCVFDCLVKNGKGLLEVKKCGGEVDERDERVLFGSIVFGMRFASWFYDLGSGSSCLQGNRKVVFGLHEEFLKLEKECSTLGFEFTLPEVVECLDGGDENVSHLMGVDNVKRNDDDGKVKMSKEKKSKKKKKKKNQGGLSEVDVNGDSEMVNLNDGNTNMEGQEENVDEFVLSEAAVSNLQKQFEKIAAESGLEGDGVSALESPLGNKVNGKPLKKRKRSKVVANVEASVREEAIVAEQDAPMTEEKSNVKRVKFSMKNNLVWKPHSPLPPQSLRIPPSVTPRGSALKKGLSPGPIRETSSERKKKKKVSPLQKARKVKAKRVKKAKAIPA